MPEPNSVTCSCGRVHGPEEGSMVSCACGHLCYNGKALALLPEVSFRFLNAAGDQRLAFRPALRGSMFERQAVGLSTDEDRDSRFLRSLGIEP